MTTFADLKLALPLHETLSAMGYETPTPIQAQAIPIVMSGADLLGLAQTGTGKTAAFSLPILHHINEMDKEPPKKSCHALILAPTRELVTQISNSVRSYGKDMLHLSVSTIYGGVPIHKQIKRMSGGVDIIVATPGRLIDLLDRGAVKLDGVNVLVLDEADQMMDMGFIHALKKIVPLLPKKRQTLLFSATMVPKIKRLAEQFLTDPKTISVSPPNSTASKIEQRVTFVTKFEKAALLGLCLLKPDMTRAIVFTRTKHGADRVVKRLREIGIDSRAIHGNKSQAQRQRTLDAFRRDEINILVATDVAARGIDIPAVSHVFNYEIPNVPEQYVHRIGRTARANLKGVAHAFVGSDERAYLKAIQKLLKADIPEVKLPEDFAEQSKDLKLRPALATPEKPASEARKGRGKSRAKSKRGPKERGRRERKFKSQFADQETAQNQIKPDNNTADKSGAGENRHRHTEQERSRTKRPEKRPEKRSEKQSEMRQNKRKSPRRDKPNSDKPNREDNVSRDKSKRDNPKRDNERKRKTENRSKRDDQSPQSEKPRNKTKAKSAQKFAKRSRTESRPNQTAAKSEGSSPNKIQLKRGKRKRPTKR